MLSLKSLLCLMVLLYVTYADIYFHEPRGSNNRLDEKSANRRNGNRVFDSQNNNKGGYNIGDATDDPFGNDEDKQYLMKYFQSSLEAPTLWKLEWTNQHGCGGDNEKVQCNLVIQQMCQPENVRDNDDRMRDGTSTSTQEYRNANEKESERDFEKRKESLKDDRALHEGIEWYDKCTQRERNKGLFIADQNVGGEAKNTRQNPNGQRRGLECPEERDYHPYWHPSPWMDVAVLSQDEGLCDYYKSESFNVKPKHECVEKFRNSNEYRHHSRHNNKEDCEDENGEWMELHSFLEKANARSESACNALSQTTGVEHKWAVPYDGWKNDYKKECLVALSEPDCQPSNFSRVNHLGNGVDLEPNTYLMKLPYFPSGDTKKCVLRIRYNISTDDYHSYQTDSDDNNKEVKKKGLEPLIENNPKVDIGADGIPLQLAINTAQFGRTFQDRSHCYYVMGRSNIIPSAMTLHNLSVKGKRGNIVQTFPAVEYNFHPPSLSMAESDGVHIQWTGSNTHNNGNPAGDGQAGDDGEGKSGTDRNNILGFKDMNYNYPMDMDEADNFCNNFEEILWVAEGEKAKLNNKDICVQLASSGYFQCVAEETCGRESMEEKNAINPTLDNAPASYGGVVVRVKKGTYYIVCTRNNNFTNRSEKNTITVE